MSQILDRWSTWGPYCLGIMRIVASFMFIQAGTMKLFGWPAEMPGGGTVELFTQIGIGALLEFVGGLLMLIGLWVRPVAFVLSGEMAVAYWQFHAPGSFWTSVNGGVPAVLYCFLFLYYSMVGAGRWSVDSWCANRKGSGVS